MKTIHFDSKDYPIYISSTFTRNSDKTYTVKHIFSDSQNKYIVTYPRVEIRMNSKIGIDIVNGIPDLLPFEKYDILPDNQNELFNVEIK